MLTGIGVTGAASAVQIVLDASSITRTRLLRLAVVVLFPLVAVISLLAAVRGVSTPATAIHAGDSFSIHVPSVTISLGDSDTLTFILIGLVAAIIAGQAVGHTAGSFSTS
jgi:hypothetical protein